MSVDPLHATIEELAAELDAHVACSNSAIALLPRRRDAMGKMTIVFCLVAVCLLAGVTSARKVCRWLYGGRIFLCAE